MQTLRALYEEISSDNNRWSYYKNTAFNISEIWDSNCLSMKFIETYFDYAGKSQCFKDRNLDNHHHFIEERASHIISTFLLGIKLFESFGVDTEPLDQYSMNLKYYWFLTCLYHDVGYALENKSTCDQLRMLQSDGLDAIQEICDIKYLHSREFRTFSEGEIDLYLKGRSKCYDGKVGCIDHGIVGGLLLYDKLRKQFENSWKKRSDKANSRESFYITDECANRTLHLSNKHYEAYAKAADAIMIHNIWLSTFNTYLDLYGSVDTLKKHTDRILYRNSLSFILSIADTIEPLKRGETLDAISIESLPDRLGVSLTVSEKDYHRVYENSIRGLHTWIEIEALHCVSEGIATVLLYLENGA